MAYNDFNDNFNQYNQNATGYNQNNVYNTNPGYNPNMGYNQNPGYNSNMGYNQYSGPATYNSAGNDAISASAYNTAIGGFILYGLLINALMAKCFGDTLVSFTDSGFAFILVYFAMALGGCWMIKQRKSIVFGFIGYNLVVVALGFILGASIYAFTMYGLEDCVSLAFLATAAIVFTMMFISNIFKDFFLSIGRALGITLLCAIVIEFLFYIFTGGVFNIFDIFFVGLFSLYIGYDWAKANSIQKTYNNALYAASELYVDIVNIILRLMRIFARSSRR